jgi:hypothetical protein
MITLETAQSCAAEPEWLVIAGGSYAPDALVECVRDTDPTQRVAFYALTISTGEYPQ